METYNPFIDLGQSQNYSVGFSLVCLITECFAGGVCSLALLEEGVVRVWLGKGEHGGRLRAVVLHECVLLALHTIKEGEACRQRETSQTGKCHP